MKYSLRSLMIAVLAMPPLIAETVAFIHSTIQASRNLSVDWLPNDFDLPHYGSGTAPAEPEDLTDLPTSQASAQISPKK